MCVGWALVVLVAALVAAPTAQGGRFPVDQVPEVVPFLAGVRDLRTGDVDGDGFLDVVAASGKTVAVLRGISTGWAPMSTSTVGDTDEFGSTRVVLGDLTGDDRDDAVVLLPNAGKLVVLRASAAGLPPAPSIQDVYALTSPTTAAAPAPAGGVDVGDVDGDGDLDVVAGFSRAGPFVLVNDGMGNLTVAGPSPATPGSSADLRLLTLGGDDDPDLVAAAATINNDIAPGSISILPGASEAAFGAASVVGGGPGIAYAGETGIEAGDFDGDGVLDLVAATAGSSSDFNGPSAYRIARGTANEPSVGSFSGIPGTAPNPFRFVGDMTAVGDLDRDGHLDLVGSDSDAVFYLRGLGTLAFAASQSTGYDPRHGADAVAIADVDRDGRPDLLSDRGSSLNVRYGLGPLIRVKEGLIDFGDAPVGATTAFRPVHFTNDGPGTADNLILLADGDVNDFVAATGTCLSGPLEVDEGCEGAVAFKPSGAGARSVLFAVVSDDADEVWWGRAVGNGTVAATPPPAPPPSNPPVVTPSAPPRAAATLNRRGRVSLHRRSTGVILDTGYSVVCPTGPSSCTAEFAVAQRARRGRRGLVLARARLTVKPGITRRLSAQMTRRAAKLLRTRRRLQASMTITASRKGTATATLRRSITITWPAGR